jgi:hypothetical protein
MRSSLANAAAHMTRAWSPQACNTAPPVELAMVSVTQPSPELA